MSPQRHPLGTTRDVLQLAFCVLCAVDHLNTRGWFHCDIQSDNILLMERPHIKGNIWALCDLGDAVFCQDGKPLVLPRGEPISGDKFNRSPEVLQAFREFPLLKNDVWAVGCVLYEAVSGSHPFIQGNQMLTKLIRDTTLPPVIPRRETNTSSHQTPPPTLSPAPPSSSGPGVDLDAVVCGLVGWLLERECSRRPTSREALLACGALLSLPLPVLTRFVCRHNESQAMSQLPPPSTTSTGNAQAQETLSQAQPISDDVIIAMRQSLYQVHKQTLTDIFQHNGLRFGVDPVPLLSSAHTMHASVSEVIQLVYCNMALRDVPAATRALFSFLGATSSPRYNLNLLQH
ncbi:hypothetical protein Pelo_9839 [Pelomyxa schiedti]|nr:hypothetical protein Pelo_9839 [Pelomyxa schiedti]